MKLPHHISEAIEAKLNQLSGNKEVSDADALENDLGESSATPIAADPSVSQHIVRSSTTCDYQGVFIDSFVGSFRCCFSVRQSLYVLHVPIYPHMMSLPDVDVHCDCEWTTARVTEAKKFGLRIELRRNDCQTAAHVIVEVTATAQSVN